MRRFFIKLYDKSTRRLGDHVGHRWLRQRDQSWEHGDRLSTSVQAHLRGQIDLNALRYSLTKYAEDQSWTGPAANFVIREGDKAGQLDVTWANRIITLEKETHLRKKP